MQGTAAVVLAASMCALRAAGTRMRDQRVVIHGAGTAGIGIADALRQEMITDGLTPAEATARIFALGSRGLLTTDYAGTLRDFQVPYARPAAETAAGSGTRTAASAWPRWSRAPADHADRHLDAAGSVLRADRDRDGSARRAADHHAAVEPDLALRGPARDLIAWTSGRALVATGSPFPPVSYGGVRYDIAQANNALLFPGIGLGVTVARARRLSDGMLAAAAARWPPCPTPPRRAPRAAAGHRPARGVRRGRGGRRLGRASRGPGPDHAGRPGQADSRGHVGTRLPRDRARMNTAGSISQPRRDLIAGARA